MERDFLARNFPLFPKLLCTPPPKNKRPSDKGELSCDDGSSYLRGSRWMSGMLGTMGKGVWGEAAPTLKCKKFHCCQAEYRKPLSVCGGLHKEVLLPKAVTVWLGSSVWELPLSDKCVCHLSPFQPSPLPTHSMFYMFHMHLVPP